MLLLHKAIWILICIEKLYANVQTMFRGRSNTTRLKLYETVQGSHFQQCAAWCSQSDRCKSFSVEPAPLMCSLYSDDTMDTRLYSDDTMDTHHPLQEPMWVKILNKSLKNEPVPGKKKLVSPLCVNGTTNVALNKATNESSFCNDIHESSQRAVDGNSEGTCIHTKKAVPNSHTSKWWSVDLAAVYDIKHIRICNNGKGGKDALGTFNVYVGNRSQTDPSVNYKFCVRYSGFFQGRITLKCKQWSSGQFVKIDMTNGRLPWLCEVEVQPILCVMP